jgi:hypothetical protein
MQKVVGSSPISRFVLLVLDEPVVGLDPPSQRLLRDLLTEAKAVALVSGLGRGGGAIAALSIALATVVLVRLVGRDPPVDS